MAGTGSFSWYLPQETALLLLLSNRSSALLQFLSFLKPVFFSFTFNAVSYPIYPSTSLLSLSQRNSFCGLQPREPTVPVRKEKGEEFGVARENSVCGSSWR